MLNFIQISPLLSTSSPTQCLRTHRLQSLPAYSSKRRPAQPTKRLRMTVNDRSTEFSLGEPGKSPRQSSKPSKSEDPIDWDDWRLTGRTMTVPVIPFSPLEIFLPGESKQLHLYEARFLALFENIVLNCDKRCAHILIDSNRRAMAAYGTVIHVRSWRRLDVGVSVEFEAVGRLKTKTLHDSRPYLSGDIEFVEDDYLAGAETMAKVRDLETQFWQAFREVVSLCVKLGEDPVREKLNLAAAKTAAVERMDPKEKPAAGNTIAGENNMFLLSPAAKQEFYEQKLKQAARRAANLENLDFSAEANSSEVVARRAMALSFAGFDFFPSSPGMRQKALEQKDTVARLETVVKQLKQHSKRLAAKVALQDALSE